MHKCKPGQAAAPSLEERDHDPETDDPTVADGVARRSRS